MCRVEHEKTSSFLMTIKSISIIQYTVQTFMSFLETGFVFQNARPPRQRKPAGPPGAPDDQRGGQGAAAGSRVPELPLRPLHLLPGRHQRRGGRALQPSSQPDDCVPWLKCPQDWKRCECWCAVVCFLLLCLTLWIFPSVVTLFPKKKKLFT